MWAKLHKCCVECGTTERPHKGLGLCERCHSRIKSRKYYPLVKNPKSGKYAVRLNGWSVNHACCVQCGTSETPHRRHGLCRKCAYKQNPGPKRERKKDPEPVVAKPVKVPRWDLYGTLASNPYLFYGQEVCDIRNQYGERIMQVPLHLVKFEVAN